MAAPTSRGAPGHHLQTTRSPPGSSPQLRRAPPAPLLELQQLEDPQPGCPLTPRNPLQTPSPGFPGTRRHPRQLPAGSSCLEVLDRPARGVPSDPQHPEFGLQTPWIASATSEGTPASSWLALEELETGTSRGAGPHDGTPSARCGGNFPEFPPHSPETRRKFRRTSPKPPKGAESDPRSVNSRGIYRPRVVFIPRKAEKPRRPWSRGPRAAPGRRRGGAGDGPSTSG